ncbi:hypothetical protein IFM89_012244 [Coptis chinensis]|uniref:Myb/SANT-like domain-containing protein n=1 Tax=Coptis chinensis TaxID=261450 RepID=A0A835LI72_9MAGN|nr:hypothetical protein IFM89_012244 [Coptis chinensis]
MNAAKFRHVFTSVPGLAQAFLDLCLEEVTKEGYQGSSLKPISWKRVRDTLNDKFNLNLEQKAFKNRWDAQKKKYVAWRNCVDKSGGEYDNNVWCFVLVCASERVLSIMNDLLNDHMFATHAITAAGSVALGSALTHPLDTLKTLVQVGAVPNKKLDATKLLDRVRSLSGNSGLYSGFMLSTFGRISGVGARFGIFELLTAFYKDGREDNYVYVSEALLAGIAAGALEGFVSTPFELLKLRAQVTSASSPSASASFRNKCTSPVTAKLLHGYSANKMALDNTVGLLSSLPTKHPNMVGSLKEYPWMMTGSGKPPSVHEVKRTADIISLEGWRTLWRGLRSGVVRDSVFGGMFFSSWQFLHIAMLEWKAAGMDPPPRSVEEIGMLSPWAASVAAGVSGSVAAAASHCFDTAKSRSQCIVLPKYVSMERRLLKWKQPGYWVERVSGIHPKDRNILFRGIGLRMARSGLASFAIVGSYYMAVGHLM